MKRFLLLVGVTAVAMFIGVATAGESMASRPVLLGSSTTLPSAAAARVRVPNVVGFRMDRATRTLHERGLRVNEECSGLFGCIVKSRWWVCVQSPRPGRLVAKFSVVVIYGERRGEC
jgi:hypothetical protein